MFPRRLLPSIIALSLVSCWAHADSIKLKSGEILRGTITEEDPGSVTIVYEAAKGIRDERKIPRSDIEQTTKEEPSDRAWAVITARLPTSDLMGTGEYDLMMQKVEAFLGTHGTSMKASEARRLLEVLREERGRIANGGIKLDGRWLDAEQYQREKFWVDGRIALKDFTDAAKSGKSVEALRLFEKLEADYKGTTVFVRAVETAKVALSRYSAAISEAMLNQPQLDKQRRDGLASLSDNERKATENAQAAQAAASKIRAEEEKKSGTKWFTLDPYNLPELQAAKKTVDTELARLGTLNLQGAAEQEATLRQIDHALNQGRLDVATELIQQASQSLSGISYLRSLQERARTEAVRLEAEKKAADEARAEALRRAAKATPAPPVPPKEKEKDPLEDAVNPLTKAVLESDLGKRVNRETTPTSTVEPSSPVSSSPPTPTPSSGNPSAPATTETATTTTPTEPAATAATKPAPSATEKTSGGGMTSVLYGVAGLLVVFLLALLLSPMFKRKKEQEQVYTDNPLGSSVEDEGEDGETDDPKQG